MFFLILIASLCGLLSLWIWKRYQNLALRDKLGLKGPPASLLLGSLGHYNQLSDEEKLDAFTTWRAEYGDVYGWYFGKQLSVVIFDLDLLKEVFIKKFSNFTDRPKFLVTDYAGYSGQFLTSLNGEEWKSVRSMLSPVFSSGKLKQIAHIVSDKDEIFISKVAEYAKSGEMFDIYKHLRALTLDVIAQAAFGIETKCQIDPANDQFYKKTSEFISGFEPGNSKLILGSLMFPELEHLWGRLRFMSPFGPPEAWLINLLERVVKNRRTSEFKGMDIIQMLLQHQKDGVNNDGKDREADEDGQFVMKKKAGYSMTDMTILGNCLQFLIAGYETTSTALGFTCWLLGSHPHVQKKLQQEWDEHITYKGKVTLTYDMLKDMKYLDAVFHESLRLCPPVTGFVTRLCIEACTIGNVHFQPGMEMTAPVLAIHRDPTVWRDPLKFDPDRFIGEKSYNPMAWMPFGVGPRNCIGLRFAEMEYKMSLANLISRFTLTVSTGNNNKPFDVACIGVLMQPKNGVWIKAEAR